MKKTSYIIIFLLVFSFQAFAQERKTYHFRGQNIDDIVGETYPRGSIHKLPSQITPDTLSTGDTFTAFLIDDPTYGSVVFYYAFSSTSDATHDPPGVINMHGNTDPGRFILMRSGEWPCNPADSDCYLDFPLNDNDADAPGANILRLSAKDDNKLYMRLNGGNPLEIATTGSNISGTAAGLSSTLAIGSGGTGQTTAQAAINALTGVSAATDEHVLTKDTTTGNAVFKAVPATGGGTWGSITGTLSDQTDLKNAMDAKAPLSSPALTGNPTAPTQTQGNNSTRLATTAYVDGAVVAGASGYVSAPTYSNDLCIKGQYAYGPTHPFYCIDTNTWDYLVVSGTDIIFASWDSPAPYRYLEDGITTRKLEDGTIRRLE